MFFFRLLLLILCLISVVYNSYVIYNYTFIPIKIEYTDFLKEEAEFALIYLNAPSNKVEELSTSVSLASRATGISPTLLVCIIYTESTFKKNAVSNKNYKGLMQTPSASFIYSDVDILHGARIFQDKMRFARGNTEEAMMLYKGGRNPLALRYARETLKLYDEVKNNI